jgi:hypothetical protein
MFDAVLELIFGLILIGSVAVPFIAGLNADQFGTGGAAILGVIGLIGLLLVVWSFVKGARKGGKGLFGE